MTPPIDLILSGLNVTILPSAYGTNVMVSGKGGPTVMLTLTNSDLQTLVTGLGATLEVLKTETPVDRRAA